MQITLILLALVLVLVLDDLLLEVDEDVEVEELVEEELLLDVLVELEILVDVLVTTGGYSQMNPDKKDRKGDFGS